jgi:hypothetical protein
LYDECKICGVSENIKEYESEEEYWNNNQWRRDND